MGAVGGLREMLNRSATPEGAASRPPARAPQGAQGYQPSYPPGLPATSGASTPPGGPGANEER